MWLWSHTHHRWRSQYCTNLSGCPPHPPTRSSPYWFYRYFFAPSLVTQRNILFVTHTGFFFPLSRSPPFSIIKRGQPSINPAITHAITLTIRLSLICVICYMNVEGAPAGKGFTLLELVLHSLFTVCFWNRCGRIQEGQQSLLTAVWFGKRGGKKSTVQGHFLKLHYLVLLNLTATPLYSEKLTA